MDSALAQPPPHVTDDPLDDIVPAPMGRRRALRWGTVGAAAVLLLLFLLALLPQSGIARPNLAWAGTGGSSWSPAPGDGYTFGLSFPIVNRGPFDATITGVDASAPGLSDAHAALRSGLLAKHPARFPYTLHPGEQVTVTVTFRSANCRAIDDKGSKTIPVHARGPIGTTFAVPVTAMTFTRPTPPAYSYAGPDPYAISWAAGITWATCHHGQ